MLSGIGIAILINRANILVCYRNV